MNTLYVILGAAVGAPARFAIDQYFRKFTDRPLGTFLVNVFGSFLIGLTFSKSEKVYDLVAVGFAGAFTTWSTFMLDIYLGYELKRYREIAINLIMSLGFGLAAAYLVSQSYRACWTAFIHSSIASGWRGIFSLKFRYPSAVTTTSSSMRIPIPRYSGAHSSSSGWI